MSRKAEWARLAKERPEFAAQMRQVAEDMRACDFGAEFVSAVLGDQAEPEFKTVSRGGGLPDTEIKL